MNWFVKYILFGWLWGSNDDVNLPELWPFITQLFAPSVDGYGRRGVMSTWDAFSAKVSDKVFKGMLDFLCADNRNTGIVCLAYGGNDGLISLYEPFKSFSGNLNAEKVAKAKERRAEIKRRGLRLIIALASDGDVAEAKQSVATWGVHARKMNDVFEPDAIALSIETNEWISQGIMTPAKANEIIKLIGAITGKPCGTHTVAERWCPSAGDFILNEIAIGDIWEGHKLSVNQQVAKARFACGVFKEKVVQHEYAVFVKEQGYIDARNALANVRELAGYG